ncbi:MAG: tetratricopeptide repeat protein, partial [Clostridiales bacterium]|nr:tetratricopeptide repeat protein [Clostridiales bacterium]
DRQAARDWYKKSLTLAKRLAEVRGTPEDQRDLSVSYEKLGVLAQEDGDRQVARDWYKKALDIRERLVEARGTPEDWRDLSLSYEKMGNLAREDGDWQAARERYEKSLAIRERLVDVRGTVNDYDDLAVSFYKLATVSVSKQEQLELAKCGLSISETLYKGTGIPRYQTFIRAFKRLLK